jgi:cyanate permease
MAVNSIKRVQVDFKSNYLIAFILFGMYVSFGMAWMGFIPLLQDIEAAYGIGHSQGSWLISIISLAKSIFPIITGVIAARYGLTKTLRFGGLLIFMGIIIPWLPDYFSCLAGRFLFGIGGAMWVTLMGAVTMQVFEAKHRPVINSLNGVAVNVGVIISLWFSLPISEILGWQMTLTVYSMISGLFVLLLWYFGDLPVSANNNVNKIKYTDALKLPVTWIISFAFTGPLVLYLVFNTWLPIYYQEVFNIAKLQTMQWMTWMNLWGIPAALATGFLLQMFRKCKAFILTAAILLPVVSATAVIMNNSSILAVMLALTGIGLFLSVAPLITLLQNQPQMNPQLLGMVLGTMFSVTYILSSIAPGIIGYCYDLHIRLDYLLLACCLLSVSPAIALLLAEKK